MKYRTRAVENYPYASNAEQKLIVSSAQASWCCRMFSLLHALLFGCSFEEWRFLRKCGKTLKHCLDCVSWFAMFVEKLCGMIGFLKLASVFFEKSSMYNLRKSPARIHLFRKRLVKAWTFDAHWFKSSSKLQSLGCRLNSWNGRATDYGWATVIWSGTKRTVEQTSKA